MDHILILLIGQKAKKATINPIIKKDSFQYAVTAALNCEEIKKDPRGIAKIKPFINKYNWQEIHFHQKKMIGKTLTKII